MHSMTLIFLFVSSISLAAPTEVVDPIGDETLGSLEVIAPIEPAPGIRKITPFHLAFAKKEVAADKLVRLRAQKDILTLRSPTAPGFGSAIPVEVMQNKTTQIQLGALFVEWDTGHFAAHVGPAPQILIQSQKTSFAHQQSAARPMTSDPNFQFFAVVPDTFQITIPQFPIFPIQSLTVTAGLPTSHRSSFGEMRATLKIVPPARVVFPDAHLQPGCMGAVNPVYVTWREKPLPTTATSKMPVWIYDAGRTDKSGATFAINHTLVDSLRAAMIPFFPTQDGQKFLIYDIALNNVSFSVSAKAGDVVQIPLKRLDVNDVRVTREDGSTYMAPGKFQLFVEETDPNSGAKAWRQIYTVGLCNGTNAIAYRDLSTKTGVTVFPGVYRLSIDYKTEEGMKRTDMQVDLR